MVRAALVSLVACTSSHSAPPITADVCAQQHTDGDVIVCDRAYDDLPRIHLPADQRGGPTVTIYAALAPLEDQPLILRDGTRAVVSDAQGKITFAFFDDGSHRVPEGFDWFTYHFLEDIYEVTGTMDTDSGGLAIRDATARPVVRIVPEVLDAALTGAWEGTMSKRIGLNMYDGNTRIPIRVAFDCYQAMHQIIPMWAPSDPPLSYSLVATGTIANATSPITLSDGTCAPALASLGDASPIAETDASVVVRRYPAMHSPGDYQLVDNGWMGPMLPAHPAALIQDAVRTDFTTTGFHPHGTPNGMHLDGFHAVAAGGDPCTP